MSRWGELIHLDRSLCDFRTYTGAKLCVKHNNLIFFLYVCVAWTEPSALCIVGKWPTAELHPNTGYFILFTVANSDIKYEHSGRESISVYRLVTVEE